MKAKTKSRKRSEAVGIKIVVITLLTIYFVLLVSLFLFTLINSLKDSWSYILDPIGFPKEWHFENYATIFKRLYVQRDSSSPKYYLESMFGGSFLYATLATFGFTIATVITAYAVARFPCFLSKVIYGIALFMITVPIIGSLPSEMNMMRTLGFYDNIWSAFVMKFSFGNIFFLLLYEAFKAIPKDFSEAAEIDGASQFRIMTQIMFPMVGAIIGSIFLVQFIAFWNDYSTPVLYFPSFPNVSIGLIDFAFSTSGEIATEPFKLGACVVAFIPMLIVFAVFQNKLMAGASSGGIKG